MTLPFLTIGHSTRTIDEFVSVLTAAKLQFLVDVRTFPRSSTNPQFNSETLATALSKVQIGYAHIASLGGRRGRASNIPSQVNAFWENQSFHNYADYAMSDEFQAGLTELLVLGLTERCVIMCAEAVWWRCHRRIIADYLIAAGEAVFHVMGPTRIEPARMTPAAKPGPDGTLTYPA